MHAASLPGRAPSRSTAATSPSSQSATAALSAARDQLVLVAGVIADTVVDPVGHIGRSVLAQLLPEWRVRVRDRIAKRAKATGS